MYSFTVQKYPTNERIPVSDLSPLMLESHPMPYDFSAANLVEYGGGDGNPYTYTTAVQCDKCGRWNVRDVGENDNCEKCNAYLNRGGGPVTGCYYPLADLDTNGVDIEWGAKRISHLPLVIVTINPQGDETLGLALSGGGMNLSWEICEAFTCLGYLPPTHFAEVAAMCNRGKSEADRYILAACKASFNVAIQRATRALERLNRDYPEPFTDDPAAIVTEFAPEPDDEEDEDEYDDYDEDAAE